MSPENSLIKPRTCVLGIGGAGIKTLRHLSRLRGAKWLDLGIADTDIGMLQDSGNMRSFPVGVEWTRGLGCGGDITRGSRAFAHKSSKDIEDFLSGASLLIVTGGLGGGSGTGGSPVIGRMARRLKIPTVFLMTTPFMFEGQGHQAAAEEGIKLLLPDTDVLVSVPNDILFSSLHPDIPAKKAFEMVDESVSRCILGISEVLRCNNMLAADFADFKSVLSERKAVSRIGLGLAFRSDERDCCSMAVENLLESPLLGGIRGLAEADALILTLIGGEDLEIGEMKQALEAVKSLTGSETRIISGVNTDPEYDKSIFITALAVSYQKGLPRSEAAGESEASITEEHSRPQTTLDGDLQQPELAFMSPSRGYFSKTSPNVVHGEDLDIPPFQRQGLNLDKGV
ncbi:MAG: hypothetical protein JW808_03200 [Victivallales bacterium]|nr:hypothetical protein [Victivallales bacterium]